MDEVTMDTMGMHNFQQSWRCLAAKNGLQWCTMCWIGNL